MAVIVLFAAVPLAAGAPQMHELPADQSTWTGSLRPGATLQIRGGLGDIEVVASEGDSFTVDVKRGSEGKVAPRIVIAETEKGATICADWTTSTAVPSRCGSVRGVLAASSPRNYVRADLRIAVPRGTAVDAQSTVGNIRIAPLGASVRAETYEGEVSGTADGPKFKGENLRGNIEIRITPETLAQHVEASSIRGTIRIVLPESRLVKYDIWPNGSPVLSAYPLGVELKKPREGQESARPMALQKPQSSYSGFLGPNGKVWLKLEVHMTAGDGRIEIAAE